VCLVPKAKDGPRTKPAVRWIRETRDFTRAGGEPLEMKAFFANGPHRRECVLCACGKGLS
jgi:hypothetical protein